MSKYNRITGSLKIGFNGIVAFSNFLLNAITIFGLIMAAASVSGAIFMGAIFMALAKIFGWWESVTGVATLVVLVLFLAGMQFLAVGIMGAYVSRIYDEVKMRPKFIVEKTLGLNESTH